MSEYIDNQAMRKDALKSVVRQLHTGRSVDEVKDEFAELLRDVGATEVAEIEQALIEEGLDENEIKRLCDVHVAVFRDGLSIEETDQVVPGHPVHIYRVENAAAARALDAMAHALELLRVPISPEQLSHARAMLSSLQEYEKHYSRKENVLFPYLERHGFAGPSTVMWAIHDDIRAGWHALETLLAASPEGDPDGFIQRVTAAYEPLAAAMREMFFKEENILFPAALERLSSEEWLAVHAQGPEIGYAWITPADTWAREISAQGAAVAPGRDEEEVAGQGLLRFGAGGMTLDELDRLISHLPLDITYVDGEDRVRFFSLGKDRIFPRTPAIIGRKVQQCHPPASVERVQRILDEFRAGERDLAEFWIQAGPDQERRFIHIRYFALRDERGDYQGTLEVTQDVTDIRRLESERRLLDEGGR
jgi:DUF438 domain-containing protein